MERRGEEERLPMFICLMHACRICGGFSRGLSRGLGRSLSHIISHIHTLYIHTYLSSTVRTLIARSPNPIKSQIGKTPRKESQINLPPQKTTLHSCKLFRISKLPKWPNPRCISPTNASAVPMQHRQTHPEISWFWSKPV